MNSNPVEAASLLAIDVGEISTRAVLFDNVDGRYRFLALGESPTTAGSPYQDIGEGIRLALVRLQEITGRKLTGSDARLIMPALEDGSGVDTVSATLSVGPPLKVVAVGLLEEMSLESARNLARTIYVDVAESLNINDHRKHEERIDAILRLHPDVIIIAGGIEGGASKPVFQMIEAVGLACYLTPGEQRPQILYAGNQALLEEVKSSLDKFATLHVAPNIRPTLEDEQLHPAQSHLVDIFRAIRSRQISGVKELDDWTDNHTMPTASAFGRVIQFLSNVYDSSKGVLGIDIGSSATTIAAAFKGNLTQAVYSHLGLGRNLASFPNHSRISDITRWLPMEINDDYVSDYLFNKSLYAASLPVTEEDLAIEQSLARHMMQTAIHLASKQFPKNANRSGPGFLPWFEPIVAAGSILTRAPSPAQSLLMILDALQPTGITTVVLDQNNLSAPLGSAAGINPILVVQVLESSTFLNLGTVISPISNSRPGTPILRVKMKQPSEEEISLDIKQGSIDILPLPLGQSTQLHLQPLHRSDVGMGGPGQGGRLRVIGGIIGVIIDGRGRPLHLPTDISRRRELFKKWLWTLGG
jgi:hypothetical protein